MFYSVHNEQLTFHRKKVNICWHRSNANEKNKFYPEPLNSSTRGPVSLFFDFLFQVVIHRKWQSCHHWLFRLKSCFVDMTSAGQQMVRRWISRRSRTLNLFNRVLICSSCTPAHNSLRLIRVIGVSNNTQPCISSFIDNIVSSFFGRCVDLSGVQLSQWMFGRCCRLISETSIESNRVAYFMISLNLTVDIF